MARANRTKRAQPDPPRKKKIAKPRTRRTRSKTDPAQKASTEEKIKEAARKLFTQKGFAATRTRDIAEEAGINLALLNYYFRSKQKLFDIIMMENFRHFLQGIQLNFYESGMPLHEKLSRIVTMYIDFLTQNPDLPLFVLNELRNNPDQLAASIDSQIGQTRTELFNEIKSASAAGLTGPMQPFHLMANFIGLMAFPFVARPILQKVTGVTDTQFNELMQQRKELIPLWIKTMLQPPSGK